MVVDIKKKVVFTYMIFIYNILLLGKIIKSFLNKIIIAKITIISVSFAISLVFLLVLIRFYFLLCMWYCLIKSFLNTLLDNNCY